MPAEPIEESAVYKLPKWVKILFRFYAVVFLLYTIVVGIQLFYSVSTSGKELLAVVADPMVSTSGIVAIAAFTFALVVLILEVLFGVGVYRFRRWVLPLVLTFSFSTLLVGLLSLLKLNFDGITDLIGTLIGMVFMGVAGYAAIKYWSLFTGSARKLLIQIPLFLVLLPFILFATLSQIFTDDKQINDSDLVLQPVELLPQSNNAHYSLPAIDTLPTQQQKSYETALQYAKEAEGINLNNQEAIHLISQTRSLTDAVIEASTKSGYQCPTSVNNYGLDAELCSLNDIRGLAALTAFRAEVEADTGNTDQAIRTAVSVVKLGDLVGNAEQTALIEHLVGIAVMNIGLESLERTLNAATTTSNQTIRSAILDLEQSKISDTTFADSLRGEYMGMKDTSKSFEQFSSYFYQHNKTVNQRAEVFRMGVAISSQGCDVDTTQEQQEVNQLVEEIRLSPTKWPIISPNFIGKVLNSVVVASLNTVNERGCEVNERITLMKHLLNIYRYVGYGFDEAITSLMYSDDQVVANAARELHNKSGTVFVSDKNPLMFGDQLSQLNRKTLAPVILSEIIRNKNLKMAPNGKSYSVLSVIPDYIPVDSMVTVMIDFQSHDSDCVSCEVDSFTYMITEDIHIMPLIITNEVYSVNPGQFTITLELDGVQLDQYTVSVEGEDV